MPPSPVQCVRPDAKKQALIDEYGEVDRRMRLWKPQVNPDSARCEELEAEILSWGEGLADDKSALLAGKKYEIEITARGFKSDFTAAAQAKAYDLLKQITGLDLMQFFSITLAEARLLLGKDFITENVPKLQTGPREVNVVPRAEAAPVRRRKAA